MLSRCTNRCCAPLEAPVSERGEAHGSEHTVEEKRPITERESTFHIAHRSTRGWEWNGDAAAALSYAGPEGHSM